MRSLAKEKRNAMIDAFNSIIIQGGARGLRFETFPRRVLSLSKTIYSPKVLVIPRKRWLRPDMTEKLLTGTLSLNTNKLKR